MSSTNMFDLLNDDAQDQEIKVPAVAKAAPSKPAAAKATPAAGGANRSAGASGDNRGPRKDGAGGARPNRPRPDNANEGNNTCMLLSQKRAHTHSHSLTRKTAGLKSTRTPTKEKKTRTRYCSIEHASKTNLSFVSYTQSTHQLRTRTHTHTQSYFHSVNFPPHTYSPPSFCDNG